MTLIPTGDKMHKIQWFRKKPVVVEAYQWDGTFNGSVEIGIKFPTMQTASITQIPDKDGWDWRIKTLEGEHIVSPGDWVLRGVKGEFYPCKPDIFELTYEVFRA